MSVHQLHTRPRRHVRPIPPEELARILDMIDERDAVRGPEPTKGEGLWIAAGVFAAAVWIGVTFLAGLWSA